jgi:DNA-binding transcriptional LysR family regulator
MELFTRRGLSLDRLRSFLFVVDAGGLPAAAPGNPVRQSQLGRQIHELEEFFGTALVKSLGKGKGLGLTPAGKHLAFVVRDALAGLTEVPSKTPDEVELTIGAGDSVIQWWIAPHKDAFGGANVRVSTMSGPEVVDGLLEAVLDLGIIRTTDLRHGLRSSALGTIDYAVYVAKDLLPKGRTPSVKNILRSLRLGTLSGEPSFTAQLETVLEREKVQRTPAWLCETFPGLLAAVKGGWCAAVLPTLARAELPARVGEYRDPILDKLERRMCLAWAPRLQRQRPRVAALIPSIVRGLQRA